MRCVKKEKKGWGGQSVTKAGAWGRGRGEKVKIFLPSVTNVRYISEKHYAKGGFCGILYR
jgi:hypothetical protein